MKPYIDICKEVLSKGDWKESRTGVRTLSITGAMFKHDMRLGFPLVTTRKMYPRNSAIETEGFIKGITDKQWYKDQGCHFWDNWCNPEIVPYGHDPATQKRMAAENDLGPIYGAQWREWESWEHEPGFFTRTRKRHDQLQDAVDKLNKNPFDRQIIVSAWNVDDLHRMALPPCHVLWQLISDGKNLDLLWYQRSVDTPIGLPYNIFMYALILTLVAKTVGMRPRLLVGHLGYVHIYEDQVSMMKEQVMRMPKILPEVKIASNNIFTWAHEDIEITGYRHHPAIKYPISV